MWEVPTIVSDQIVTCGNFREGLGRPWEASVMADCRLVKIWTRELRYTKPYS